MVKYSIDNSKRGACMEELKSSLLNDIKIIPQGELILNQDFSKAKSILMSEEFQNYSSNLMQEQLSNMIKVPDYSNLFKTREEMDKHLTDRMDNTNQLLKESNQRISELQSELEKSYEQLQQANDKMAIQTSSIKNLEDNLKIESLKREAAEGKLSGKDWKTAFVGLACTLIVLGIEHWRTVLNFILSLFA